MPCPVCGGLKFGCASVEVASRYLGCWQLEKQMRKDPELRARLGPQVLAFRGGIPIDEASIDPKTRKPYAPNPPDPLRARPDPGAQTIPAPTRLEAGAAAATARPHLPRGPPKP